MELEQAGQKTASLIEYIRGSLRSAGIEPGTAQAEQWLSEHGCEDAAFWSGQAAGGARATALWAQAGADHAHVVRIRNGQREVLASALSDAIAHRQPEGGYCADCAAEYGGLCSDHIADETLASAYHALADELGIELPQCDAQAEAPEREWVPGPEVDDEGGMSEYRFGVYPDEPAGWPGDCETGQ